MSSAANAPLLADLAWPNRLPGSGTIKVTRKLNSTDVIDALTELFILRGTPAFIRSDNGPEFVAQAVRDWIAAVGAKTAYIESGSPWENGYCESFNGRFRDERLNGEVFFSLSEAQILIERWRKHYNTKRPHSALGYRPPAPEAIIPMEPRPIMHEQLNWTSQMRLLNCLHLKTCELSAFPHLPPPPCLRTGRPSLRILETCDYALGGLQRLAASARLGSGLIASAERKILERLSYRMATRRQSLRLPNMISIRLRRL